ncbi:MAG: 23S rRNA (guanosine(2251)-2'-O)-methyltransferase RlmB [Cyanobacteria bacterium SZAS-4]|nr:23S rRNA (guanosine(2251)-2'-O)-methyltransferase RlmB [Cyanobacteria bacterium SZAS-4]
MPERPRSRSDKGKGDQHGFQGARGAAPRSQDGSQARDPRGRGPAPDPRERGQARDPRERGPARDSRNRGQQRDPRDRDQARDQQNRGQQSGERGARDNGAREQREDDGTEMIFGKNAVLAFLEDSASEDEDGADIDGGETDDDNIVGDESREKSSGKSIENTGQNSCQDAGSGASKHVVDRPRGQVRKPEIGKIYMVTLDHPDRKVERIKQLAKAQRIPVVICDRRKLDWLVGADQVHQGIAAQISAAEFWELSDFLEELKKSSPDTLDGSVLAIVDGIEDPHNLGAIIRVAESAGLKGLLLPARRSAGLTGIVAKTSAGALASLPIVRIHNLVQALEELKESGFWIAGLDSNQGDLYTKTDLVRPLALVIGSEGTGMSRLVKDNCDMLLKIPMLGKTESLNASVAAGIVFYEVVRQLQSKGLVK